MHAACSIDKLAGNAQVVARLAHAAFEYIAYPELAADPLHIGGLALVGEGRVTGDDEEVAESRKSGGDLFHHAVSKVFLLGVAAHVGERQDGDRWLVRKSQSRPFART